MKRSTWYATEPAKPENRVGGAASSCPPVTMWPAAGFAVVAVPQHVLATDRGIGRPMGLGGRTG